MTACLLAQHPYERVTNAEEYASTKYQGEALLSLRYLRKINLEAYAYSIKADALLV